MLYRFTDPTHFHRLIIGESFSSEQFITRSSIRFSPTDAWRPNINIYETRDDFIICADLAGMTPDSIQVDIRGNVLTFRGRRDAPMPPSTRGEIGVHLMEIDTGVFCREIKLPDLPAVIDPNAPVACSAAYKDGLLWIKLAKPTGTSGHK